MCHLSRRLTVTESPWSDFGNYTFPITSTSHEAQQHMDDGMVMFFGFNEIEVPTLAPGHLSQPTRHPLHSPNQANPTRNLGTTYCRKTPCHIQSGAEPHQGRRRCPGRVLGAVLAVHEAPLLLAEPS